MFSSSKFLCLVFADETDSYFIESGTEVRFYSYIWYQLCKSGYKGIYFLDGTRQNLRLEFLDRSSFNAYIPKPIFGVLGKAKAYSREERIQRVENPARFILWMLRQMKKGKQAFIIPLDVFYSLVSDPEGEQFLNSLIDLSVQKTESTILLTASLQSNETLKMLTGKVFRHCNESGRPLCREFYDILHKSQPVSLYEAIYEELNGAAVFLNVYDRDQLRQLIYAAQYRQTKEFCPEIELEAITDYVYYWCRSRSMRDSEHILAIPKRSIRFADLYRQLKNEVIWRRVRKAASNFYNSKRSDQIESLYPDLHNRMEQFCCGEAVCYKELAKAADAVDLNKYREYGGSREDILQFERLKKQVHTPGSWAVCAGVEEYVLRFLEELGRLTSSGFDDEAFDNPDIVDVIYRISQLIEALGFGRQYLWKHPDTEDAAEIIAVCELYAQYLDISKMKCRYSRKRRQLKRRCDEQREYGELDAELKLQLENTIKKEQISENAEREARKQLNHCKTDLEEHHFETIRDVLKKWETEKNENRQPVRSSEAERDENDAMQEQYDLDAAKRIAKMFD